MLPCGSGDERKSCLPLWKSEHNSFDRDRPLTAAQCESSFTAFWGNADLDFQKVCFIRWPSRVVLPRFGGEARSACTTWRWWFWYLLAQAFQLELSFCLILKGIEVSWCWNCGVHSNHMFWLAMLWSHFLYICCVRLLIVQRMQPALTYLFVGGIASYWGSWSKSVLKLVTSIQIVCSDLLCSCLTFCASVVRIW